MLCHGTIWPSPLGYGLALIYGHLGWLAVISFGLLLFTGFAVRQQQVPVAPLPRSWGVHRPGRLALAMHWLPGFYNGRAIDPSALHRRCRAVLHVPESGQTPDRLLAYYWSARGLSADVPCACTMYATALALTLERRAGSGWRAVAGRDQLGTEVAGSGLAVDAEQSVAGDAGGRSAVSRLHPGRSEPTAQTPASWRKPRAGTRHHCYLASFMLGTRLAMGVAGEPGRGVGYGLAYRFGGLGAAIATHFGLNLLHFGLFTVSDARRRR